MDPRPDRQRSTVRPVSAAWTELPCPARARAGEVITAWGLEIDPTPLAPGLARRALAPLAPHMSGQAVEDMNILVSELVTNAVLHAGADLSIEIEAFLFPDEVAVSVADRGPGFDPLALTGSRPGEPGGRGLELVVALSRALGIDSRDPFRVWFSMAREAA